MDIHLDNRSKVSGVYPKQITYSFGYRFICFVLVLVWILKLWLVVWSPSLPTTLLYAVVRWRLVVVLSVSRKWAELPKDVSIVLFSYLICCCCVWGSFKSYLSVFIQIHKWFRSEIMCLFLYLYSFYFFLLIVCLYILWYIMRFFEIWIIYVGLLMCLSIS